MLYRKHRKHIFTRSQHGLQYYYILTIWSGIGLPSLMPARLFSSWLAMALSAVMSSIPITVSTDAIEKTSSYLYKKRHNDRKPKGRDVLGYSFKSCASKL